MIEIFLNTSIILISLLTILWIFSIIIKNASIIDLFWGFGFVVVNACYFLFTNEFYLRKYILFALVTIWGLRLSIYLSLRNIGKGEDFRYQNFREKYGAKRYWWISYFQVFLLQGILLMIVSTTLFGTNSGTNSNELNIFDLFGIIIWTVGLAFEAGGDYQMYRFKSNPKNKGKVLNRGFWKYTRHPNYFGDSAVWWAYGLFSIASGSYWHILGSVLMTLLIIKVSGVSLLEKSLKDTKPEYAEYIKNTSSFFPMPPKNSY
jgi:steroid 5-alpha reductase family enzyme